MGIGSDLGNKRVSRLEDNIAGQGQGTKLLIIVKTAKFASDLFTYISTCFLKRKRVELCLINWKLYARKFYVIWASHIMWTAVEKGLL